MMREYITSFRFLVARSIVLPFLPDCGAGAAENNPSEFLSAAPTRKKNRTLFMKMRQDPAARGGLMLFFKLLCAGCLHCEALAKQWRRRESNPRLTIEPMDRLQA